MRLAIEAGHTVVKQIMLAIFWLLDTTNDLAWYYANADIVRPVMGQIDCTSYGLYCIRQAKDAALTWAKNKTELYWASLRQEEAEQEQARLAKEADERYLAEIIEKAKKYDEYLLNPPVTTTITTTTIHAHYTQNLHHHHHHHHSHFYMAQSTEATDSDLGTIGENLVNSPFFNANPNELNFFKATVLALLITILLASCCCMCRCLVRCCKRTSKAGHSGVDTVTPGYRERQHGAVETRDPACAAEDGHEVERHAQDESLVTPPGPADYDLAEDDLYMKEILEELRSHASSVHVPPSRQSTPGSGTSSRPPPSPRTLPNKASTQPRRTRRLRSIDRSHLPLFTGAHWTEERSSGASTRLSSRVSITKPTWALYAIVPPMATSRFAQANHSSPPPSSRTTDETSPVLTATTSAPRNHLRPRMEESVFS